MCNFGLVKPSSESTFPFQYIKIFQKWQSLESLDPLQGLMDICAHRLFCTKLNTQQLLFETFFDIMRNFGSTI